MTEALLALVAHWGPWLIFAATYASCLALPAPASLVMLAGGAFVASGDLEGLAMIGAALAGAMLGDQTGFFAARHGARRVGLNRKARKNGVLDRARSLFDRWGGGGVFLSRWLFSPLGPYVNFIGGASGMGWLRFTAWAAAGEVVWVAVYMGLGYGFAEQLEAVADILTNTSGALAAAAIAGVIWVLMAQYDRAARR